MICFPMSCKYCTFQRLSGQKNVKMFKKSWIFVVL